MKKRDYYSIRTGKNPSTGELSLEVTNRLIRDIYSDFKREGYFDEYFGFYCVDLDNVEGKLGSDIEAKVFRALKKDSLYPFESNFLEYSEDDLFDVMEFLFDCISKPISGEYHSWGDCGMHWEKFDKSAGEEEFTQAVNEILIDYSEGFKLSDEGEVLIIGQDGLKEIFEAEIDTQDPENVDNKIKSAIKRFRHHRASIDERKNAVRELFDILEYLKSETKDILNKKDESDLFKIANNFGIRHHNKVQKTDYDEAIWLSWMFYFCLSTIYAYLKIMEKQQ